MPHFISSHLPTYTLSIHLLTLLAKLPSTSTQDPAPNRENSNAIESPTLHLRLLLFAFQTALTTAICVVEYSSWPELSAAEKSKLGGLYIPYLVFGELVGVFLFGFSFFPADKFVRFLGRKKRGKGGREGGMSIGWNSANRKFNSCGDVCRYVWEGQSEIDDSWGIVAEVEGFMMLAALIRRDCDSEKAFRAECLALVRGHGICANRPRYLVWSQ